MSSVKENEGLKMMRSVIAGNEDKVVYIQIGATWCPGTRHEIPFQVEMAEAYKDQPLRIVNFYLDNGLMLWVLTVRLHSSATARVLVSLTPVLHRFTPLVFLSTVHSSQS